MNVWTHTRVRARTFMVDLLFFFSLLSNKYSKKMKKYKILSQNNVASYFDA